MKSLRHWSYPVVVIAALGAYLFGFVSRDQQYWPNEELLALKQQIREATGAAELDTRKLIWSIFLPLDLEFIDVPVAREGYGGAITEVDGLIVLLTHEGRFFGLGKDSRLTPLAIEPPDNGFQEYSYSAEHEYSNLSHIFQYFRYNDILFVSTADWSGLIASYTEWRPKEQCYATALAKVALPPSATTVQTVRIAKSDWQILYRTKPCLPLKDTFKAIEGHMAGGRIAFLPPAAIVMGSGDYMWDGSYAPIAYAQDPLADYGKVLRIDLVTGTRHVVSIGHRNPQGITVARDGTIWETEHGPRGGDELNRILPGGDYGWPLVSLGTEYNKLPVVTTHDYGRHDGYEKPVFAFLPSVGISSVAQTFGFDPAWDGDLLVGSLTRQSLFHVRVNGERILFAEEIEMKHRIRSLRQRRDGDIVLWTDDHKLIVMKRAAAEPASVVLDELISELEFSSERTARLHADFDVCLQCHSLDANDNATAPNLRNAFGRNIASTSFSRYSSGLRNRPGSWTKRNLEAYLNSPAVFAPGTAMPSPHLKPDETKDIVELLKLLSVPPP